MSTERRMARAVATLGVVLVLMLPSASADKNRDIHKHYGLIFGTAYGLDDRPLYGMRIVIHPVGKKHPSWELLSDHRGEFAQRVPPGPADYEVTGEAELAPVDANGTPQMSKKKKFKAEAKVHIEAEERQDVSLHLTD